MSSNDAIIAFQHESMDRHDNILPSIAQQCLVDSNVICAQRKHQSTYN